MRSRHVELSSEELGMLRRDLCQYRVREWVRV